MGKYSTDCTASPPCWRITISCKIRTGAAAYTSLVYLVQLPSEVLFSLVFRDTPTCQIRTNSTVFLCIHPQGTPVWQGTPSSCNEAQPTSRQERSLASHQYAASRVPCFVHDPDISRAWPSYLFVSYYGSSFLLWCNMSAASCIVQAIYF